MKLKLNFFYCFILMLFLLISCANDSDYFAPKPKGYFRIELPEKEYIVVDTTKLPFTFEYPKYSILILNMEKDKKEDENWFNIIFPEFSGVLYFSHKTLNDSLYYYAEDTYEFVYKHVPKAEQITAKPIDCVERKVHSLVYFISGIETASPLQFYITDSTDNFVRGALYFDHIPNNDSIAPIINLVSDDILHIIETWQWK